MSREEFSDDCPGCRPVILDMETRQPLPDEHPAMQIVLAVWAETTRDERVAFHEVTCNNSRTPDDLRLTTGIWARMQAALSAAPKPH